MFDAGWAGGNMTVSRGIPSPSQQGATMVDFAFRSKRAMGRGRENSGLAGRTNGSEPCDGFCDSMLILGAQTGEHRQRENLVRGFLRHRKISPLPTQHGRLDGVAPAVVPLDVGEVLPRLAVIA